MRVVVVESFERIHRSNLVGMVVLPLQFKDGGILHYVLRKLAACLKMGTGG